jgi:mRNA interferase MazF
MASVTAIQQGDIWWMETADQKRRPVMIVSRNEAIPVLSAIVVAPLTSTIRAIPTCIPVGPAEGVDRDSVATFDSLTVVPTSVLTRRIGALAPGRRHELCAALHAMADC